MVRNTSAKLSIKNALDKGFRPCKICKPPMVSEKNIAQPRKKINGVKKTTQCFGITKKGTRCKHRTQIGNRFCYQHLP